MPTRPAADSVKAGAAGANIAAMSTSVRKAALITSANREVITSA
jgi:hypothetical protein